MAVRYENRAYVLLTSALSTVVTGMAGLAIDVGFLRYEQRHMQSAADSAAIAGASELAYSQVPSAALVDAAKNGFQDGASKGVGKVSVTVDIPPTSGPHNGDANYAEVIIGQLQPTFFAKIPKMNSGMVQAQVAAFGRGLYGQHFVDFVPHASSRFATVGGATSDDAPSSADFANYVKSRATIRINPYATTVTSSWAANNQPGSDVTVSVNYDSQ